MKFNIIITLFLLIGCSKMKSKSSDDQLDSMKSGGTDYSAEVDNEEDADFVVDSDTDEDDMAVAQDTDQNKAVKEMTLAANANPVVETTGEYLEYKVEKGDTLMLVAFKLYGDYRKWRDIVELNPTITTHISYGTTLKYDKPVETFVWNPKGEPHLVRLGETLGSISTDKYQTPRRWREIWENNKPMIIDPNRIFAGFTIYYVPMRDVASE